jgi:hypothetical protein
LGQSLNGEVRLFVEGWIIADVWCDLLPCRPRVVLDMEQARAGDLGEGRSRRAAVPFLTHRCFLSVPERSYNLARKAVLTTDEEDESESDPYTV